MTDRANARAQLSEMTEITEHTISRVAYRDADLDALYRACPTAFWLAPDADDILPPRPGPDLTPATTAAQAPEVDPSRVDGLSGAVKLGVIAAGPIFAALGMGLNGARSDASWWEPLVNGLTSLIVLPLTVPVGAVLAALPVLVGVLALGAAGCKTLRARAPAVWAATGGAMGAAIAAMFGAGGPAGLALIATSVACARIARSAVQWTDPDPA